jgi:aryl-alcohol dehydrogenase-like predicted oxidoreductase
VIYSALGLSGLTISRVSFGCAAIGGHDYGPTDDRVSIAAVRQAIEEGINCFDTADVYGFGHSEERLGEGLGDLRSQVVVATKVGVRWDGVGNTCRDLSKEWILQAVDGSLRRLGLDTIPLYQIHWPDPNTPLEETLETLVRLQEVGKIRHIGCCNFGFAVVAQCQKLARIESVQLPYSIIDTSSQVVFEQCRYFHQMAGLCYNTLAHGLFGGRYDQHTLFTGSDLRHKAKQFHGESLALNLALLEDLKRIGAECGRSSSQVAIRWVLANPAVTSAIVGVRTPAQAVENARSVT